MKEKRFMLINRITFFVILVLNIVLPILLPNFQTELELLDSNVYYEYDEEWNYSECEVELIFNKSISSGSVIIYFYDVNGDLIDTSTAYFTETGDIVYDEILYIEGKIDSYELDNLDFNAELEFFDFVYLLYYFIPVTLLLFIYSLLLSYRKYEYNNLEIEVYAGYYNHYIKINGEKFDEHKTLSSFTPIVLSCTLDSGEKVQVTISLTNRITLKINDKLYANYK